jgi:hypothetical protein
MFLMHDVNHLFSHYLERRAVSDRSGRGHTQPGNRRERAFTHKVPRGEQRDCSTTKCGPSEVH